MYLRARDYGLRGLEVDFPGLRQALARDPKAALARTRKEHVPLLYWTAMGWGGAMSLKVNDSEVSVDQPTVEALARQTDARVTDARPWVVSSRRFMCWEPRCHFEFSYPFLLQTRRGEFHLVYTWNRSFIKHVEFNQAWLDERLSEVTGAALH